MLPALLAYFPFRPVPIVRDLERARLTRLAILDPEEVLAGILELLEQFEDADTVLPAPYT